MKTNFSLYAALGLGFLSATFALGNIREVHSVRRFQTSFVPENTMYIPPHRTVLDRNGNPIGGGITHAEFDGVINAVAKVYAPIVKAMGGNLVVHRNWEDGTVNADADRIDENWNISFYGGLARHKFMTIDSFLIVVCHELGHQIGGAPKIYDGEWASDEGQSDYWATLKCARRVLRNEPNLNFVAHLHVPDVVRKACTSSFRDADQAAICIRMSMAALANSRFLADVDGDKKLPRFTTPDPSRVETTDPEHPKAQCRLDIQFQGALCPVHFDLDVDPVDPTIHTCSEEAGDKIGFRPRCWYAPGTQTLNDR